MASFLSKRTSILAATALVCGVSSYTVGVSGINVGQAITQSRCSAGAFITHSDAPKDLQADSHSDAQASVTDAVQQDPKDAVIKAVTPLGPNLLANPGVESLAGGAPDGWSNNRYGNNNATFSQVLGHNSPRALRIDITKYTDGTADWFTGLEPVTSGAYYQFQDFYRSNVQTHATLQLKDEQGKSQYFSLGTTPVSTDWTSYSVRFFVPANVHQILVSHTLDRVGALETDDYSLTQVKPIGFSEPVVSLTFDDGWQSIHNNALPILKRYSLVSTQYIISGFLGAPGFDTPGQLYDFTRAGSEIASHTLDHKDLVALSPKDLTRELTVSQKGLSMCYGATTDFASPYGTYNIQTTTATAALYQTGRSTDTGFNSADQINPYQLKTQSVRYDTTPEQIQAWLATAKANHLWLILVYHQVDNGHGPYSRTPVQFESDMQKVFVSGMPVRTIHDAYSEIKPQL